MVSTIKVLVVDDSALIRQMLTRTLSLDPSIEIVGIARDGAEAVKKAAELQPDVITLDIRMPELNGLDAIPFILKRCSARIVMLTSVDDPDMIYQALSAGAVDFVVKPSAGVAISLSELTELLLKKIKTANRIVPAKSIRAAASQPMNGAVGTAAAARPRRGLSVVGVAASTGGPPALETLFGGLDASLPAAYAIVQHLPAGFSASLAKRLSKASDIVVAEAADGAFLERGTAYVAPHGMHMRVEGHARPRLRLEEGPSLHGVCPSADPLFESLASTLGPQGVGVVLTGMGSDGAAGLLRLRQAGGATIAQDEASSIVWGMPRAAERLGAVERVLPLGRIAGELRLLLGRGGSAA